MPYGHSGRRPTCSWVWGTYTEGGTEWDFEVDASMLAESMTAWEHERQAADERIQEHTALDSIGRRRTAHSRALEPAQAHR